MADPRHLSIDPKARAPQSTASIATPANHPKSPESFESLARRNAAAEILESYEKLSWWSQQRCESLVQTRLHFTNIVAGFTPADEESLAYWKLDRSPHPPPVLRELEGARVKLSRGYERKTREKARASRGSAGEDRGADRGKGSAGKKRKSDGGGRSS